MSKDPLDRIVPLPPITLRQLNSIAYALAMAEIRYPGLLQLTQEAVIPVISVDDLGDLAKDLRRLTAEVIQNPKKFDVPPKPEPVHQIPDPAPAPVVLGHRPLQATRRYAMPSSRSWRERFRLKRD